MMFTPCNHGAPVGASATYQAKVRIEGFHLWYGTHQALRDVTMVLPDRRVTALIGPSGCGKTTLLTALNRIAELRAAIRIQGVVAVDGIDLYGPGMDLSNLRRRVGMVFQRPNPFPMSIFDNVVYGLRIAGLRNRSRLLEVAESSLRRAALWDEVKDRLHRSALVLSGGQQQRLCIARALSVQPEVLLMDEPTSALDPASTLEIEQLVRGLAAEVCVVMVTHNLQQAARISDVTGFMLAAPGEPGQLVEFGPTAEVFHQPRNPQTRAYLAGRFG